MIQENKNFLEKLTWKESAKGKWYLDRREQQGEIKEIQRNEDFDILEFEWGGYDIEKDDSRVLKVDEFVICELGTYKINKIEDNQAFLQMGETEVPVPLISVKKLINIDFIIVTKTNSYNLNQIELDLNQTISDAHKHVADLLNLIPGLLVIYFKDVKIESNDKKIHTLDINENDKIVMVLKESPEYICKRSSSKDSTSCELKHMTAFSCDKPIIVYGFGFFRNYDANIPAVYDISVYEMTEEGAKIPLSILTNIRVLSSEVDAQYLKKVNVPEFEVKPHIKYYLYVHFKNSDMKTYFFNSGLDTVDSDGVKFKFHQVDETGYKCSKSSGHLPWIYYKFNSPLKD